MPVPSKSPRASASTKPSGSSAASLSIRNRSRWRASFMSPRTKPTKRRRSPARPPIPSAPWMYRGRPAAKPARTCWLTPIRPAARRRMRCSVRPTKFAPCSKPCRTAVSITSYSPFPAAMRSCAASPARSCRSLPVLRRPLTRRNKRAAMADNLKPRDAKEVERAIQWALADGKTLEIVGHGTKRAIGRAAQWDATLDLSGLSGVTLYEPEELVLSAKAGTPLAEIEALVASRNQQLAFEPMDYALLLGGAGGGTIGGAIAANLSGPRRIKAGAARDHFLGMSAVSGRGEIFKSGGRVVKNVTGYDLCKLLAGSWGTLAAMTDVTIKTLPKAETEETILVLDLDGETARKVMTAAM